MLNEAGMPAEPSLTNPSRHAAAPPAPEQSVSARRREPGLGYALAFVCCDPPSMATAMCLSMGMRKGLWRSMSRPGVLLDRDGVINVNRPTHVTCWSDFSFLPGVISALRRLTQLNVPVAVVTNQAIVNRNIITHAELATIHQRMVAMLRLGGARVDGIFYCPHDWAEGCDCRKPAPGLLLQAADALDLDLSRSVFVGDAATDVAAGQRVSCHTILVRTGRGIETEEALAHSTLPRPTYVAPDLLAAVPFITSLVSDPTTAQEAAPLMLRAEGVGHEAAAFAVAATD